MALRCLTLDEISKDSGIQIVIEPSLYIYIRESLVRGYYHKVAKVDG